VGKPALAALDQQRTGFGRERNGAQNLVQIGPENPPIGGAPDAPERLFLEVTGHP